MIQPRRPLIIAGVLAIATLNGCGLVPSTNTAARVDDEVLTQEQLQTAIERAAAQSGVATTDGEINMNFARSAVSIWVFDQALSTAAAERGVEVPPFDGDPLDVKAMDNHWRAVYTALATDWANNPPSEEVLAAGHDRLLCFQAMTFASSDAGDDAASRLAAGDGFATVSAEADAATFLGCVPPDIVGTAAAVQLSEPAFEDIAGDLADAAPGEVVGPFVGQGATLIVRRTRFEELDDAQRSQLSESMLLFDAFEASDIEIASLYGTFSPVGGVIPLGFSRYAMLTG